LRDLEDAGELLRGELPREEEELEGDEGRDGDDGRDEDDEDREEDGDDGSGLSALGRGARLTHPPAKSRRQRAGTSSFRIPSSLVSSVTPGRRSAPVGGHHEALCPKAPMSSTNR